MSSTDPGIWLSIRKSDGTPRSWVRMQSAADIAKVRQVARRPMDATAFSLAGMRGCLDPYVSVFLLTGAGWTQERIGLVLTISGLIGISLHMPLGAIIDATRAKRGLIVLGAAAVAVSALAIAAMPAFSVVLGADITMAIVGGIFAPTLAAIALGVVGRESLAWRLGRNAAFDRGGNLFAASVAGLIGYAFLQQAVFCLVPVYAAVATLAILKISGRQIDHNRARALDFDGAGPKGPLGWHQLCRHGPLVIIAATSALFHFANAPMLFMLGQKLALGHPGLEIPLTSMAVIVGQLATIPAAMLLAARGREWGWKPFMIIAVIALPVRGLLLALSDQAAWLITAQVFDGLGVGIFDAVLPLALADFMRGSGRYNVGQGFVGMVQGAFGSLSNVVAGALIMRVGYDQTFLLLGTLAIIPIQLVIFVMPKARKA
jgi:Major Facilitator Superfamily